MQKEKVREAKRRKRGEDWSNRVGPLGSDKSISYSIFHTEVENDQVFG